MAVGQFVLQKLQTAPLQLNDLMSWLLFGVGAIFSIVACLDGFYWSDVYPGYADVQKRLTQKRDAFINISREIMAVFREIRDEYSEKINDIGQDLALRRSEYDKIIANQQRMANLFARHQNQIENATNALLGMYHDANISTRQTKVPAYFSKKFKLDQVESPHNPIREIEPEKLAGWIKETNELLTQETNKINEELNNAIEEIQGMNEAVRKT